MDVVTAEDRYDVLSVRRDSPLSRAREFAKLTIPSLLPEEGSTEVSNLPESYQSLGARCTIGLASRLMSALLPPAVKWFRLIVPPKVLLAQGQTETPKDVEQGLSLTEHMIESAISNRSWRSPTYTALQHLIVTGNVVEQMLPDGTLKIYRLDQYVVVRDVMGQVLELIIREEMYPDALPDRLRGLVNMSDASAYGQTVPLYTWVKWEPSRKVWKFHQEIQTNRIPGTEGTVPLSPFNVLRWSPVLGSSYGRSKVEEHYADFRYLEGISKAVKDGSAMAARHITVVKPSSAGSLNILRRLSTAQNGDVLTGDPESVGMLQFTNTSGLQIAAEAKRETERALGEAFLLTSAYRRDAERVTAYEVSKMAEEIESVLGGVFSMLANDMQEPRLRRIISLLKASGDLPPLPDGMVEPQLLTGLEALDRERDVERGGKFAQFLQVLSPEERAWVDMPKVIGKVSNGLGWPDVVRSEKEYNQALQTMTAQAMASNVDPVAAAQTAAGPQQ